eukprot:6873753-Prymnesium_polylepis.2
MPTRCCPPRGARTRRSTRTRRWSRESATTTPPFGMLPRRAPPAARHRTCTRGTARRQTLRWRIPRLRRCSVPWAAGQACPLLQSAK